MTQPAPQGRVRSAASSGRQFFLIYLTRPVRPVFHSANDQICLMMLQSYQSASPGILKSFLMVYFTKIVNHQMIIYYQGAFKGKQKFLNMYGQLLNLPEAKLSRV